MDKSQSNNFQAYGLRAIIKAAEEAAEKGLPPVHLWEPDYCGDIGLKIDARGQWYYAGSPIGRKKLVKLFSTILRHDEDDEYYLVTPVEKIRVEVEDAPFIVTLFYREGEGQDQQLIFETNIGDFVKAGKDHAMRFEIDAKTHEPRPYLHVRANLEALISRAVFYDLVALGEHHKGKFGVWSEQCFFPIIDSDAVMI